jgi:CXXC-20-CXXC protein
MKALHRPNCPNCKHFVGWKRLILHSSTQGKWPCENCGQGLKYNLKRRRILLIPVYIAVFFSIAAAFIWDFSGLWLLLYLPAMFLLLSLEKIELAENPTERQPIIGKNNQVS